LLNKMQMISKLECNRLGFFHPHILGSRS